MAAENLYPPILKEQLPAFVYNTSCAIPVGFSSFNNINDINKELIQVKVTYLSSNNSALTLNTDLHINQIALKSLQDDGTIILEPTDIINGFEIETIYKVQMRFTRAGVSAPNGNKASGQWLTSNVDSFSEWSTACLLIPIAKPTLIGWPQVDQALPIVVKINAELTFDNRAEQEVVQQYRFKLYSINNTLLEDSGLLFPKSEARTDIIYEFKTLFTSAIGKSCYIQIEYETENGYISAIRKLYSIAADQSYEIIGDKSYIEAAQNEGAARLILNTGDDFIANLQNKSFSIRRSDYTSNFSKWEIINTFESLLKLRTSKNFNKEKYNSAFIHTLNEFKEETTLNTDYVYLDYSVEHGGIYKYGISYEDDNGATIFKLFDTEPIVIDFEDIFLISGNSVLNIKFNPTIGNFKYNLAESITPTLGGVYPYIRRNGHQKYRTFSIGGMIAYNMDKDFYSDDNDYYNLLGEDTSFKEIIIERKFREQVLDFLSENNVKLFKSATEGNILIKLTGVTLTPEKVLGRKIYSFTATATEVAENTFANYKKHRIFIDNTQYKYLLNVVNINSDPLKVTDGIGYNAVSDTIVVAETLEQK